MHVLAPQSICARTVHSPPHAGGDPSQHEGCIAHTCDTHGSKQTIGSSGPATKQTECGHVGSGMHTPQSCSHELQSSPSHAPSPHTHAPPQSCGHELQSSPEHVPSPQQPAPQIEVASPTH